jgi:ribosomal protein S18 acetylase RimI-like enzyme
MSNSSHSKRTSLAPPPALSINEATGEDADAIEAQVDATMDAFNREHLGDENERRIVLIAKDAEGRMAGALVAWALWDYLYLENLWVAPAHRQHGTGTQLLRALEDTGRARGLRMIQLYTFTFEAPDFYRKQGYSLAGHIPDSPSGTSNHWFYKLL